MDIRRYQSKDPTDKEAITEIVKDELSRRKEPFDEQTWESYLKKRDAGLQSRMGMILAVDGTVVAGFVFAEIRTEISGREYGYFHFPAVKRDYKTKVEELLVVEAIKHLKSLKMKEIRTRIPPTHALAKSVIMKLAFKQFELEWQILDE